ncbi:O-methyltransferase [Lentzea flaviverrucosa]|uniref:O-methyltransferase n=2 Tax=Lentzea flaviverrucosa TaxID=200379 RepID=A0A1H9XCX0_9PSEU|nr:O-methyltransferase [Lentzea flaviverrucosa]SES43974.1 O-methyltransferase [Lentzea flaviverrucosa]
MSGLITPMALRVAVTLGLPDRLRDNPATARELAPELEVDPLALDLLLAHLTTLGVAERTASGYRTTDFGALLGAGAGNGLNNLLHHDSAAGRADLAFVDLVHSVRTGEPAYPVRYGQDFWTDLAGQRHLRDAFDQQMTDRMRNWVPQIVRNYDWSRFGTLVDVGGGHGSLLAAILTANPAMRGHLVELEDTAAGARAVLGLYGLGGRTEVTGGSFFDPLPTGGDAYLLFDVLHDWDDEQAHRILARCAEAGDRVLVVESLGESTEFDLVMLVHFGGRDRGLHDFERLASAHGLKLESVTQVTGGRSLLEFTR